MNCQRCFDDEKPGGLTGDLGNSAFKRITRRRTPNVRADLPRAEQVDHCRAIPGFRRTYHQPLRLQRG
jgi:hypothetical protein